MGAIELFRKGEPASPFVVALELDTSLDSLRRAGDAMTLLVNRLGLETIAHLIKRRREERDPVVTDLTRSRLVDYKNTHLRTHLAVAANAYPFPALYMGAWLLDHDYTIPSDRGGEPDLRRNTPNPLFTQSPHTHDAGFVTVLLEGGYEMAEWRLPANQKPRDILQEPSLDDFTARAQLLTERTTRSYTTGDIVTMHPDEVHALVSVEPGTRTFLLQLPTERRFSAHFDIIEGQLVAAAIHFSRGTSPDNPKPAKPSLPPL